MRIGLFLGVEDRAFRIEQPDHAAIGSEEMGADITGGAIGQDALTDGAEIPQQTGIEDDAAIGIRRRPAIGLDLAVEAVGIVGQMRHPPAADSFTLGLDLVEEAHRKALLRSMRSMRCWTLPAEVRGSGGVFLQ